MVMLNRNIVMGWNSLLLWWYLNWLSKSCFKSGYLGSCLVISWQLLAMESPMVLIVVLVVVWEWWQGMIGFNLQASPNYICKGRGDYEFAISVKGNDSMT